MHEAQLHESNCFLTLTYDDKHLPEHGSLYYSDVQKFYRRVRKKLGSFRHFTCGEYGPKLQRPHYHACIFGLDFPDKKHFKTSPSGGEIFTSALLDSLWTEGFASVGGLSYESARYVAGYCTKKITGQLAATHYARPSIHTGELVQLEPEFGHMSLKPGIGHGWYKKYKSDVFPRDHVVYDGLKLPVPKYYYNLLKKEENTQSDEIEYQRFLKSNLNPQDHTRERLATREQVATARASFKKRNLELSK